jgi:hypothetical protein
MELDMSTVLAWMDGWSRAKMAHSNKKRNINQYEKID